VLVTLLATAVKQSEIGFEIAINLELNHIGKKDAILMGHILY